MPLDNEAVNPVPHVVFDMNEFTVVFGRNERVQPPGLKPLQPVSPSHNVIITSKEKKLPSDCIHAAWLYGNPKGEMHHVPLMSVSGNST